MFQLKVKDGKINQFLIWDWISNFKSIFDFWFKIKNQKLIWKSIINPFMESIIQKNNFLKNENCIISFFNFWNINLNVIFRFFEIRILISIWVSIKIETKFEFMEFDCDVKRYCLVGRCYYVVSIMSILIQWLALWMMTLWKTKWIVGKEQVIGMFQRRKYD